MLLRPCLYLYDWDFFYFRPKLGGWWGGGGWIRTKEKEFFVASLTAKSFANSINIYPPIWSTFLQTPLTSNLYKKKKQNVSPRFLGHLHVKRIFHKKFCYFLIIFVSWLLIDGWFCKTDLKPFQGRGTDSNGSLGDCLHCVCLRRSHGIHRHSSPGARWCWWWHPSCFFVRPRCLWPMLLLQREENGLIRTQRVLVFTMI